MTQLLRWLVLPLSVPYGAAVFLRNWFYNRGYFNSKGFTIPIISVGNLAVGGSGKSPMVEYLVGLLENTYAVAILSRGYGRKTKGFLEVQLQSTADEVGDEPLQFKHKIPDIRVAVCEKRIEGIERLQQRSHLIILDDAFQHRAVAAGLSILLFDYTVLFKPQVLLPAGNLREPLSGRKRADILVVTKTPSRITDEEMQRIRRRVKPFPHQHLFFSYLEYGELKPVYSQRSFSFAQINSDYTIVLITGIANANPLLRKLEESGANVIHHRYPDHHVFSSKNIAKLAQAFSAAGDGKKIIITTEKDAQRLQPGTLRELLAGLPVYYLPITARIHTPGEAELNQIITNYVANKH